MQGSQILYTDFSLSHRINVNFAIIVKMVSINFQKGQKTHFFNYPHFTINKDVSKILLNYVYNHHK